MSSRTYQVCSHCGKTQTYEQAVTYHTTVCDGCGYEWRMPSSWTKETNPLNGWVSITVDGGMRANGKDFCPTCVAGGKAGGVCMGGGVTLAYIEKERQADEQQQRTKAAKSA